MATTLDTLDLDPDQTPKAVVIWMHGLGADAHDFIGLPPVLNLPTSLPVRFVFPNAPQIPVTVNGGMIMRAWYDIRGFDPLEHDETGIKESAQCINALVSREIGRGIPAERIVLAGFSQGGALALYAGLRYPRTLAGVICLSGYLLLDADLERISASAVKKVPVFQAHGSEDSVVPCSIGHQCRDRLSSIGYDVEWHEYKMAHQVCENEVRDVSGWLIQVLSSSSQI